MTTIYGHDTAPRDPVDNPYSGVIRPTSEEVPTLHGGGYLIVFDADRPVLPRFKPSSAGEVRKISWFWWSMERQEWSIGHDEGCSDEWLATHPGYGEGAPEVPARMRDWPSRYGVPLRAITWTRDGVILRDVTIPAERG